MNYFRQGQAQNRRPDKGMITHTDTKQGGIILSRTSVEIKFLSTFVLVVLTLSGTVISANGELHCRIDSGTRPIVPYCPASSRNYREAERTSADIEYIVIHTVQGSLESAVNTFKSPRLSLRRSAHYVIGKEGRVVKTVPVEDIAWHAGTGPIGSGSRFESRVLNANSIGIEHEGYVDDFEFPSRAQYITTAAMVRLLCSKYDIPIDRDHIVGHQEIKSTKGDPGQNWDWGFFMDLVSQGLKRPNIKKEIMTPPPPITSHQDYPVLGIGLILLGLGVSLLPLVLK